MTEKLALPRNDARIRRPLSDDLVPSADKCPSRECKMTRYSGFRLTFSDSALQDVHQYRVSFGGAPSGWVSGTWQPDGRPVDPLVAVDTSPRSALLTPLGQMDPNGQWTLFVADMEAGGTGKLTGWEVRAVPVIPEPSTMWMLGIGYLACMGYRGRRSA